MKVVAAEVSLASCRVKLTEGSTKRAHIKNYSRRETCRVQEELMSEGTGAEKFRKLNETWVLDIKKCYSNLLTNKRTKL